VYQVLGIARPFVTGRHTLRPEFLINEKRWHPKPQVRTADFSRVCALYACIQWRYPSNQGAYSMDPWARNKTRHETEARSLGWRFYEKWVKKACSPANPITLWKIIPAYSIIVYVRVGVTIRFQPCTKVGVSCSRADTVGVHTGDYIVISASNGSMWFALRVSAFSVENLCAFAMFAWRARSRRNTTSPIPSPGCEGLWSCDYGHAWHEYPAPPTPPTPASLAAYTCGHEEPPSAIDHQRLKTTPTWTQLDAARNLKT